MRTVGIEYPERGRAAWVDLGEPPDPGPTQIVIETRYSAITNGTERHALLGEHGWGHYPGRHGYQHVGRIAAAGSQVRGFAEGDWVFHGQYVGHRGWHVVDVATEGVVPSPSHLTMRLTDDLPLRDCALFGVAGVAVRHVRRCRVAPAQRVLVIGQGLIGGFCAQAAAAIGARVTVADLIPRRLAAARDWGAHRVLDASAPGYEADLRADAPYAVIVDGCGSPSLFHDVHRLGLMGHRTVIGAVSVRSETTFPWSMLHGTEASIEVSCHFSLDDLALLAHWVREGRVRIPPMVSNVLPIEGALEVYETLRDRPGELLGVIFDWGQNGDARG